MSRLIPALLAAALLALAPAARAAVTFDDALDAVRGRAGLGPVAPDASLAAAAQAHAEDMARHGYVSHQGRDGSSLLARARRAGCAGGSMAENIAWGQESASDALAGWLASAPHRANMMGRPHRVYGLGASGGVWVLVVADRC